MTASAPTDPPLGLYFHLPFCRARCGYCDFAVVTNRDDAQEEYLSRLLNEIRFWRGRIDRSPASLYFGGGTPSRLALPFWKKLLERIRDSFAPPMGTEITAEGNPESLTLEVLEQWRALGINRVSVGVQSFQDRFLADLDRLHSRAEALAALARVKAAGYSDWSLDLIYGLPGQTVEDWMADLEEALGLEPPHLSFYNLILHPNLPTTQRALDTLTHDPDEIQSAMFLGAVDRLESAHYGVYELSNAALRGWECRHNQIYWTGGEWIGMGMSGASRWNGEEFANPSSWQAYLDAWSTVPTALPVNATARCTETTVVDLVMLGLRTSNGIRLAELEAALNHPLPAGFHELLADLSQSGRLRAGHRDLALSPQGWLVHSEITTRILQALGPR